MSIHSISRHLFERFFELKCGLTVQNLSRNSRSISADVEVARVHLQQLVLVTCIILHMVKNS